MSTGDQTMYIRGKLAQRGTSTGAQFMRDGFDAWAESEAPARAGQMEKDPAETQMPNYGGAMSLKHAKKLNLDMGAMNDYGGAMCGGAIEVPQAVKDAVDQAKKLVDMWRAISSWIDSFTADLQDEIIDNPASQPNLVKFATQLQTMINNVKVYKDTLDSVAVALSAVGLGRRPRRGGAISWQDVGKYAQNIAAMYMWFKNNKPNLDQVLKLKSLQPYGQQVLDAVQPIFSAIGMGRRPRKILGGAFPGLPEYEGCDEGEIDDGLFCRKPLKCDGGEVRQKRMVGGMMTAEQYAKAVAAVRPVKQGVVSGYVQDKVAQLAEYEAKRKAKAAAAAARKAVGRGGAFTPEEAAEAAAASYNRVGKRTVGGRRGGAASVRGEIVKKVMRERGLSLPQASAYVKEHGLY